MANDGGAKFANPLNLRQARSGRIGGSTASGAEQARPHLDDSARPRSIAALANVPQPVRRGVQVHKRGASQAGKALYTQVCQPVTGRRVNARIWRQGRMGPALKNRWTPSTTTRCMAG